MGRCCHRPEKHSSSLESCSGLHLAAVIAVGYAGDRETLHVRYLLPMSWVDCISDGKLNDPVYHLIHPASQFLNRLGGGRQLLQNPQTTH